MTAVLIVHCDGTPADRPGMTLDRCRAFLPTPSSTTGIARTDAVVAGWSCDPMTRRDLCPACARGGGQ